MPAALPRERIGWLLRVNRRLARDARWRTGKVFAAAFRPSGDRPLAESQITRWENGSTSAPRAAIRRYEDLLGLAPHSLTTLKDALDRATGAPVVSADQGDPGRLHSLLEVATGAGPITGPEWDELTELVRARPGLVLHPPRLWQQLSQRLLTELAVAEDSAWLQRQESMSRLLGHPDAGVHAVDACIRLAADTGNPVVVEPLSLLDTTAHPDANSHILRTIAAAGDDRATYGALLAAVRKIRVRHFTPDELGGIGRSVTGLLGDPGLAGPLRPLAVQIGRALAGQTTEVRRLPVTPGARMIASRAFSQAPVDRPAELTLAELVGECLESDNPDERLLSSMFVAATPLREPVAAAILDRVVTDLRGRRDTDLDAALRTLTNLGSAVHRPLIGQILTEREFGERARYAAAWATPHCAGSFPEPTWSRILARQLAAWQRTPDGLGREILHGVTYGIGTDSHRGLLHRVREDARMPPEARTTASWLLTTPTVISAGS
ncbi:hypothetical protein AB0J83_15000 [Actinoplanes sp. NPDC049596]|uniref:hypothetical protein n=1 Tax=unclassified Actinoplanes TaxID=2626549 RepID=UPI003425176E